jgi:hypothetical protein
MVWLLSFVLAAIEASGSPGSPTLAGSRAGSCQQSPTQDLLPEIVGPMVGARSVWLVDGSATWKADEPVKTVWVLLRTSQHIRIEGRRLDAPGALTLRRGDDPPADVFVIANPEKQSVIPTGAPATIAQVYVFIPSHVFYPNPGCWEFTVRIGKEEFRIVRDLKTTPRASASERVGESEERTFHPRAQRSDANGAERGLFALETALERKDQPEGLAWTKRA